MPGVFICIEVLVVAHRPTAGLQPRMSSASDEAAGSPLISRLEASHQAIFMSCCRSGRASLSITRVWWSGRTFGSGAILAKSRRRQQLHRCRGHSPK